MEDDDEPLEDIAFEVLQGHHVDWASAESLTAEPQRDAVQQLRVVAAIAELHRNLSHDVSPAAQPPALERWGRLEIRELIGRGAFGEVYRAWDSKLDREVAVKLLHADRGRPEAATVLQEARLLARVRHPNVVTVYDADEIDSRVGLWMEFIHGRNLEQVLAEQKRFDDREVIRIGIELCRAVAAVHDAGLLHRDIKAQNLMQTDDGRLVLMDFGTGRESQSGPSAATDAAGTPLYLAPEVFRGERATVRSDIYSAGVLLFHLRTGSYPVRASTVREMTHAHRTGRRLELAAGAPGVSRRLAAAIGQAIEGEPSRRFGSIREMLAALEGAQRASESRRARRSRLALAALLLAAIAVAVVPALTRRRQGGDPVSNKGVAPSLGAAAQKRDVHGPPGAMLGGTPSPDGRYLPYTVMATGNLALFEFATGSSRVLTRMDGSDSGYATESIVSSDSSQVAYNWNADSCGCTQLRVVGADGSNDRLLYGGPGLTDLLPFEWSRDGRWILATRQQAGGATDVILVSTSDGAMRTVRTFEYRPWIVSLSPDGRYVAYDRAEDAGDKQRGIYLSAIDGGEEIPVVTGPTYDSHPLWTPDGTALVFASMRTGSPGLWLQPIRDARAEGPPRLLDKDIGPFGPITLTRRGALYYNHRVGLMDVYWVPIDPATGDVQGEPTNAAASFQGSNISPDWSPDGNTLLFASWRTLFGPGRNILVFHSMNSGRERELEVDMERVNGPHWSPDGRLIAFGGPDRRGVKALRLIEADSGKLLSTFLAQTGDSTAFSGFAWDADGRHIYVKRNSQRITRLDTSSGEEELLYQPPPKSILAHLSVSPDGRRLAFGLHLQAEKVATLNVISTVGGSARRIFETPLPDALDSGGWTHDGRTILFVRTSPATPERGREGELWAVSAEGGSPRRLGLSRHALRDIRVSPDGCRIAFTTGFPDQGLWVFENFLPRPSAR